MLPSFPGIPIPIWRRAEKKRLVHTVVHMLLISEKSQKMGYPGHFPYNGDVKILECLQNHSNSKADRAGEAGVALATP